MLKRSRGTTPAELLLTLSRRFQPWERSEGFGVKHPRGARLNRHAALCLAFATGLSFDVLAVPQAPIKDSPRPVYATGAPTYRAIEVAFQNAADGVQLAGTLTVPSAAVSVPAVLLSQGLGVEPFDRDYTLPGAQARKSFLAIADALSRNGIAVLRLDDRGAGKS